MRAGVRIPLTHVGCPTLGRLSRGTIPGDDLSASLTTTRIDRSGYPSKPALPVLSPTRISVSSALHHGCNDPEILPSRKSLNCLKSADGGHECGLLPGGVEPEDRLEVVGQEGEHRAQQELKHVSAPFSADPWPATRHWIRARDQRAGSLLPAATRCRPFSRGAGNAAERGAEIGQVNDRQQKASNPENVHLCKQREQSQYRYDLELHLLYFVSHASGQRLEPQKQDSRRQNSDDDEHRHDVHQHIVATGSSDENWQMACRRWVQCVRQRFAPNRAAGNTMNITSSRRPRDRFVIRCATTSNLPHRCASLHRLGHYGELLLGRQALDAFRKCRQDLLAHDASIERKSIRPGLPRHDVILARSF